MSKIIKKNNGWVTFVEFFPINSINPKESNPYWYFELADYVNMVVRTHSNKIAFVKQKRIPLNQFTLELPAGMVDPNETPKSAAIRECKEEIGMVEFENIFHVATNFTDTGRLNNKTHLFFIDGAKCNSNLKSEENIEVLWMDLETIFTKKKLKSIDHLGHIASVLLVKELGYFNEYL
jgi:ADP-ribose pyrophosphatase